MGIVPEDQYLLGLEGAGVINRVGPQATPYQPGQRVLVYRRGTFANRVQVSKDCIHLLPDSMTFEVCNNQGAYMAILFITVLGSSHIGMHIPLLHLCPFRCGQHQEETGMSNH